MDFEKPDYYLITSCEIKWEPEQAQSPPIFFNLSKKVIQNYEISYSFSFVCVAFRHQKRLSVVLVLY